MRDEYIYPPKDFSMKHKERKMDYEAKSIQEAVKKRFGTCCVYRSLSQLVFHVNVYAMHRDRLNVTATFEIPMVELEDIEGFLDRIEDMAAPPDWRPTEMIPEDFYA